MRKIGGLIALVLIALMVITGCDNSANSNNRDEEWLDFLTMIASQPDYTWYDPSKPKYELTTANEFLGLADLVNTGTSFAGKEITLAKGIYDFSQVSAKNGGTSFIGSATDRKVSSTFKAFDGVIDGQGSIIRGIDLSYMTSNDPSTEDNAAVGFFGVVQGKDSKHAVVRNFVFEDCTLSTTSNSAGIAVGYAEYANIENITIRNCTVTGPQGVGAVIGRLYNGGKIENCVVENTSVIATESAVEYNGKNYNAGGIVGCASYNSNGSSSGTISISGNKVTLGAGYGISATDKNAGGICGHAGMAGVSFTDNSVVLAEKTQISAPTGKGAIYGFASPTTFTGNTVKIGSGSETTLDTTTNASELN